VTSGPLQDLVERATLSLEGDIDESQDDLPNLAAGGRDGDGAARESKEAEPQPAVVRFAPVATSGGEPAPRGRDEPDEPTEIISWRPLKPSDETAPPGPTQGGAPAQGTLDQERLDRETYEHGPSAPGPDDASG